MQYIKNKATNILGLILASLFSISAYSQGGYTTVDFHQAQNDRGGAGSYQIDWVNGILNATHTDYWEGIGVPQRVIFTGIKPNTALPVNRRNEHSLRFRVLAEKGGKHAYDFPISWDQAFKTAIDIGGTVNELQKLWDLQCATAYSTQGKAACDLLSPILANDSRVSTASFPDNMGNPGKPALGTPNVATNIDLFEAYVKPGVSGVRYGDRTIEIRGNHPVSNVTIEFLGYSGSGKDYADFRLNWTSVSDQVMIRFATRLAQGVGSFGYGIGMGAGSISGGPYHVILDTWDDRDSRTAVSIGNQDNQIMSNAIQIPPPTCGLSNGSSGCTNTATSFPITYTSTDAAGAQVKFFFITNTAGAVFSGSTVSLAGSCTSNNVTVTADANGAATINVVPSGTNFTAGSFRVGACVTGLGGGGSCEQTAPTVIDEASVSATVNNTATSTGSPFVINANLANPSATLDALASLNGTQDNTLFSSFSWTVASGVTGNLATISNLTNASTASAGFIPTGSGTTGYTPGIYAYDVTAISSANSCAATARVYISVTSGASCPADIAGPDPVCAGFSGHVYSSSSLAAKSTFPEAGLTYTWSIVQTGGTTNAVITSTAVNVTQVTVTAGDANYAVKVTVTNQNGEVFSSTNCEKAVVVDPIPSVAAIYNPPACNEKTFTVDIVNPTAGWTYSIDQPGNEDNFSSQDQVAIANTPVQFTGLKAGDGFVVTVTTSAARCTATTDCGSSTNSCSAATTNLRSAPSAVKDSVSEEKEEPLSAKNPKGKVVETYRIALGETSKVIALPNPYSDRLRFNLQSSISGLGSLELYNELGQMVGTVYQGYVQAGQQFSREYIVPVGKRTNLIYVFRVGDQKVSGKLIGRK